MYAGFQNAVRIAHEKMGIKAVQRFDRFMTDIRQDKGQETISIL